MRSSLILSLVISFLSVGTAGAQDTFEARYKRTKKVSSLEKVLAPFLQECGTGNTLPELHCRAIRNYMQRKISIHLYSTVAMDSALEFGQYDNLKFEYPVTVKGCVTCQKPAEFDPLLFKHNKFWIVTRKPKSFKKGVFKGLEMGKFTIPVDPRKLGSWTKKVKPFLRVQFLFKVQKSGVWDKKMGHGITLYMGGYRVYNRCTGKVLYSEPASTGLAPTDKTGCEVLNKNKGPKGPKLPRLPKASKIRELMRSARDQVNGCYKQFQIPGTAKLKLYVVGKTGKVGKVRVTGDFKDTPTGACVVKVMNGLNFGKFTKKMLRFKYKYILK